MGTARDSGVAGSWQRLQLGDSQRPAAEHSSRDRAEPGAQIPRAPGMGTALHRSPGIPSPRGVLGSEQVTEMPKNVVCVKKYFVKLV